MHKKRILILTNRVPHPLNDGGNLAMHAMIDGYSKNGWDVFLLSMNTSRHYIARETIASIYKDIYAFETVDVDNEIKPLPTLLNFFFSSEPNHVVRFRSKAFHDKLAETLREFKPDVVQLESVYLSTYLPVIKSMSDAICALRIHNVEYQVWQRLADKAGNFFKKIYLGNLAGRIKTYEETVWKEYDLLIPITETDAEVVRHVAKGADIVTIPFGINTEIKTSPGVTEQWVGYHIGAMDWLPNAEGITWFIEEVWPGIRSACPGFEFYFAGRKMPESYQRYNDNGLHCMGEVPDAAKFIADKKILIVPIHSGGGIRVKILEAMARGKVVISTTIGMQGIDAVKGKHYQAANTPDEFVKAVQWCLSDNKGAETMGQEAGKLATERYDKNKLMKKLLQYIDKQQAAKKS